MTRLEHVNVTVSDPHRSAGLMNTLFGWSIRWEGGSIHNGYSVHVGSADDYLAFYAPPEPAAAPQESYTTKGGLNHIAVVVDDLDRVESLVRAAGFTPHNHADYEPGRRFYFRDHDNIEFEIVEYD